MSTSIYKGRWNHACPDQPPESRSIPIRYDIKNATSLGGREEELKGLRYDPPDIILVKKVQPERTNAKRERRRLQRLRARAAAREQEAKAAASAASTRASDTEGEEEGLQAEFLAFEEEVEGDAELRELLARHAAEASSSRGVEEEGEEGLEEEGDDEEG